MESIVIKNILFHSAIGFYENGISLAKTINKELGNKSFEIAPVAAVNLSFATELLLKLLYNLETGKKIHDHKLGKIFLLLSDNLQKEIEHRYQENILTSNNEILPIKLSFNTENNNPLDQIDEFDIGNLTLKNILKIHSDGFLKWRYAYEVKELYYSYEFNFNLMNEFIKALLSIIHFKINQK